MSDPRAVLTSRELFETNREALGAFLRPSTVGDNLDDFLYRRHDSTGRWIFEKAEFNGWYSTTGARLWIKGKPGSGKSTLAATIIDRLQRDDNVLAYFFCRFQEDSKRTLTSIMGTWLWQILEQLPELTETALRRQTRGSSLRAQSSNVRITMKEVLEIASNRIFFILDGLDECENASEVSMNLKEFSAQFCNRHNFLIISRDETWTPGDRGASLEGLHHLRLFPVLVLTSSDTALDIESWIRTRLKGGCLPQELEDLAFTKLTQKADGMFLWVEFQLRALMDQLLREDARMVLEKDLPDGLDGTYERMLDTVLNISNAARRQRAVQILQWITAASRPLTLEELDCALGIKLDAANSPRGQTLIHGFRDITEACGAFIEITRKDEIRLIHASAKEFLLSQGVHNGSVISSSYGQTPSAPNAAYTARACLTYLSFSDIDCVNEIADNLSRARLITNHVKEHPFLEYAVLNWWKHLNDIPLGEDDALKDSVKRFLGSSKHVVKWLQLFQFYTQMPSKKPSFHPRKDACWKYIANFWQENLGFSPAGLFDRWERWLVEIWYATGVLWPIPHIAAFFDFHDILENELALGCPVDLQDDLKFTPLLQAAHGDSKNAALTLLEHGASWDARTVYDYSAVRYACRNSLDVFQLLLERNNHAGLVSDNIGLTALHELASSTLWHPMIFDSLLELPTCQEIINSKTLTVGDSPLHLAASISVVSSATLLRQRQRASDLTWSTAKLATAMCDLFSAQGPEAFKILRAAWADQGVSTPFRDTSSCFVHAVMVWKARLVQKLLDHGADPNISDRRGRIPLHRVIASMTEEEDAFAASLTESTAAGILAGSIHQLDQQDDSGATSLQLALQKKLYSTSMVLIQHGAGGETFTDDEILTIKSNASSASKKDFRAEAEPWQKLEKYSSIQVLSIVSVLRLLSPRLPDTILSRIIDFAQIWTETEYHNPFTQRQKKCRWPTHAVLVTEEICGSGSSPVREITVETCDFERYEYRSATGVYSARHTGHQIVNTDYRHYVRQPPLPRSGYRPSRELSHSSLVRHEPEIPTLLQAAVYRKSDPTVLEYGPDATEAMSSSLRWSLDPLDETPEYVCRWLRGLKKGDRVVIVLRSEPASFDVSLMSELRLTIRTSWLCFSLASNGRV
ncbi:MAG: hypothetical protein Q9227_005278 [Pyrenula ochraceoflavens]